MRRQRSLRLPQRPCRRVARREMMCKRSGSRHSSGEPRHGQKREVGHLYKALKKVGPPCNLSRQSADFSLDYAYLMTVPNLSPLDRKTVQTSLRDLGPKLDESKQKEMAEMMSKLKGLGNSILKPFGLNTDNFQFVKDEKTGGYNMNFNQK